MLDTDQDYTYTIQVDQTFDKFLLIDDDPVSNTISKMVIEVATKKACVKSFTDAEQGLEFIQHYKIPEHDPSGVILFLDLNMPIMSGWEFLAKFDFLQKPLKDSFRLYILSSSVDERDKQRSYVNKNVKGFITKPLNKEVVAQILDGNL